MNFSFSSQYNLSESHGDGKQSRHKNNNSYMEKLPFSFLRPINLFVIRWFMLLKIGSFIQQFNIFVIQMKFRGGK